MARKQCAHCPWRKDCVPDRDIPNGYQEDMHRRLEETIADPGACPPDNNLKVMACHESPIGGEQVCVGWLYNQLGPGNNIMLRLQAMTGKFGDFETVGEQHERFEDTLPQKSKGTQSQ